MSVYLGAYAIMTLGAFAVITLLPSPDSARDADRLGDYRGLFRARPGRSLAFATSLLSLAGIPLTARGSRRPVSKRPRGRPSRPWAMPCLRPWSCCSSGWAPTPRRF